MATSDPILFASAPRQLESLLASELEQIGVGGIKPVASGVQFQGDMEAAYRVCLWSRVANRVLYPVTAGKVIDENALYSLVQSVNWEEHLTQQQTLAVDFFCAQSNITHSHYGALRVKDAVVDQFRDKFGQRPSVDRTRPDVRINVYLHRNRARIAIDLSGESLHRRGYRLEGSRAPLKENLAAALLLAAGWPTRAAQGQPFLDPLCGSGTLVIEAALMASDTAPGLLRDYFGFLGWRQFDAALWKSLRSEAEERRTSGRLNMPRLFGSDQSATAIQAATDNALRAGVGAELSLSVRDLKDLQAPPGLPPGLILTNPPYGQRITEQEKVGQLYSLIGQRLRQGFANWQAAVFTGAPKLLHRTRLPLQSCLEVDNGGIPCRLSAGEVPEKPTTSASADAEDQNRKHNTSPASGEQDVSTPDEMFANRLRKNQRALKGWVKQNNIHAYRLYDADIPEFAVAVDLYQTDTLHVVVQEYQAPSRVDDRRAEQRLRQIMATIPTVLPATAETIHLKIRKRQKGADQYTRQAREQRFETVVENNCTMLVNFSDYLDTGLFLDHRKVRNFIQSEAAGKRFLNLFGYTGAATVQAIAGGAKESLTVDMSNAYTRWAEANLTNSGAGEPEHRVLRADCLEWLDGLEKLPVQDAAHPGLFDLILLDPPTFSNSARMTRDWDVQRDHVTLIQQVMSLLSPTGLLVFSNNFRRFKIDRERLQTYQLEDRTRWSIDRDFQRNARIHQCWFIRHQ
ncbi:MAG: bifunctional 23S rRNA (guanine(2069)-N(7))-methyltransferase RlmK/23S rRNA (guanine(2445)-N(2))-methyltransferase RlmL [Gammaproteobacteria bacterium]|nr:bifunctional 23S rRNA (guanine(2069)-N(7))-methyltransferase RlmK/23S rRNA (guanine(2445)-N(2))-methyltransferase RlmL [Gammaproteobacteria bacterium]